MTLDIEKIHSKFQDITESLTRLERFRGLPLEAFLGDQDKLDVASFRLIVATEAALDICFHLVANLLNKVPEEYAGCFKLLGDAGLIDATLALKLSQMARFRNLLVHHYWKVEYVRLYELIAGSDLEDLREFMRQTGTLLKKYA